MVIKTVTILSYKLQSYSELASPALIHSIQQGNHQRRSKYERNLIQCHHRLLMTVLNTELLTQGSGKI